MNGWFTVALIAAHVVLTPSVETSSEFGTALAFASA